MKKLVTITTLVLVFLFAITSCDMSSQLQDQNGFISVKDGYLVIGGIKTTIAVEVKDSTSSHICTEVKDQKNIQIPTCEKNGSYDLVIYCTICGKEFSRTSHTIEMLTHNASEWIIENESCTEAGSRHKECTECKKILETETIPAMGHSYTDGKCTSCGELDPNYVPIVPEYSIGLEYTLSDDETYYIVDGIGTCTDTVIIIPASYKGVPVRVIGNNAFENCKSITHVVIPDGVTTIGINGLARSFRNCSNLESIVIPDSVTTIGAIAGESAFYGCDKLWEYENGVYYVNNWAMTYQGWCITSTAQSDQTSNHLVIRDGTIGIACQAFIFGNYRDVVIPDSVRYICEVAFMNWSNAEKVYYLGSPEKWEMLLMGEYNDGVTNTPIYYYSETAPTTEGNFWHYVNGVPTVW